MQTNSTQKIGEYLQKQGDINPEMLEEALQTQAREGGKLGEVLIGKGALNTFIMQRRLAELRGIPFIDLRAEPADKKLHTHGRWRAWAAARLVPWRNVNGRLVVAVSYASPEMQQRVEKEFGANTEIALATPEDIQYQLQQSYSVDMDDHAANYLWRFAPDRSARVLFPERRRQVVIGPVVLMMMVAFINDLGLPSLLALINGFYLLSLFFRFYLFWAGMAYPRPKPMEQTITEWPVYTLLIPLFHEPPSTIRTLLNSIRALDYPKAKLDVKLIVEAGDSETIANILAEKPERIFQIVRVPYSLPQTKPKACNYALQFARGEFVTIYDAEDIPHPSQLRQALMRFRRGGRKLGCLQARLNYYNRTDNLLTRCFAVEYAMWFDAMLFGLSHFKLPIPLGGTSNHFRTEVLKAIYAWDPYNVTEDADIGIRMAELGYATQILDILTLEEAPNTMKNWLKQRTRWIKGYIQTFFVHLREPHHTGRRLGMKGMLGFMLFVGSSSFAYIVMPVLLGATLLTWLGAYDVPAWLFSMMSMSFIGGIAMHFLIALSIIIRHRWWDSLVVLPCFPFYWVLHSLASIRALFQLVSGQGHRWEKTQHGVYKAAFSH